MKSSEKLLYFCVTSFRRISQIIHYKEFARIARTVARTVAGFQASPANRLTCRPLAAKRWMVPVSSNNFFRSELISETAPRVIKTQDLARLPSVRAGPRERKA